MKTGWLVIAALAVGAAIGAAQALWHFGAFGQANRSVELDMMPDPDEALWNVPPGGPRPKAVFDSHEFHFGHMEIGSTRRHAFRVRNDGDFPLVLAKLDSSCKCTLADIRADAVAPGQSAEVTLEWTATANFSAGDRFRQWAKVETNDPDRRVVELTIDGELTSAIALGERELNFSQVAVSQTKTVAVPLVCFRTIGDRPAFSGLTVLRHELADAKTAQFFDVRTEPLPADELAARQATSGCRVRVTVKPGQPLGALRQTVRLLTNLDDVGPVELPIRGEIVGDVRVVGRDYSERTGMWTLGSLSENAGTRRQVEVVVWGPRRSDVRLRVVERVPASLVVTPGQPRSTDDGQAIRIPLAVELPAGAAVIKYLGPKPSELGKIVLDTHHPDTPQLRILLKFEVQP